MDKFFTLLEEISSLIGVPLHPDSKRACRLNIDHHLRIQFQDESDKDRIVVAAFIGEIPPGKFRERALKETLKENNLFPRLGTFGYSEKNNQLILFAYVYYPGLKARGFVDFLKSLIEKSLFWKKGLETGALPERGIEIKKR